MPERGIKADPAKINATQQLSIPKMFSTKEKRKSEEINEC